MYSSCVVTVVLLWCDIWCVTVGEEHRLRVYENRVLRGIFGVSEWEKNIG